MLIYVKDSVANESYLIMLQQGTGDNLLDKNIKDGYVGYVDYYVDRFTGHYGDDNGFHFYDCGMSAMMSSSLRNRTSGHLTLTISSVATAPASISSTGFEKGESQ